MPLYIQIHLFSKTLALCTVGSWGWCTYHNVPETPCPVQWIHSLAQPSEETRHHTNTWRTCQTCVERSPGWARTQTRDSTYASHEAITCILHTVNLFIVSLQFHPPPSPQQWLQLLLYAWHESASGHLSHFNFNMYHASEISDGDCDHVTEFRLVHADCTWSRQTADDERGEGQLSDARMWVYNQDLPLWHDSDIIEGALLLLQAGHWD